MKQKILIARAIFADVVERLREQSDRGHLIAALGQGPNAGRPPNPVNPQVRGRRQPAGAA